VIDGHLAAGPSTGPAAEVVDDGHGHHGVAHVAPLKMLVAVFLALTALTVITVVASLFDFGEMNLIVALVIAVIKASLVVLFFMHLLWDRPFNAIVFIGCLIFVGLFISLALLDTTQYEHSQFNKQAPKVPHVPLNSGAAK
jgi:cytochrome c oxidase subunit 4